MIICPLCKTPSLILDVGGITGKYACKNCSYKGSLSIEIPDEYLRFRYFFSSLGNVILLGKNAENNELLVKKFVKHNELVFHTRAAGSPFCVIKQRNNKIDEKEKKEASLLVAVFSKEWKKGKKYINVDCFLGKNIFKEKNMAIGTFGIKKIEEKYKIKAEIYLCSAYGVVVVLPYKKDVIGTIENNKKGINKEEAVEEIKRHCEKKNLIFNKKIENFLPATAIKIRWKMK